MIKEELVMKKVKVGYKKTDLGVIPKDWEIDYFGKAFNIYAGGDYKSSLSSEYKSDICPYPIYSNSLKNSGLYGYCNYAAYKKDSLTITARGTIGVANYRADPFTAIGRVLVLEKKKKINCLFVAEYINNRIEFIKEVTGVPQLTAPKISKYQFVSPSYQEQKVIAEVLSSVDVLIKGLKQLIRKKHNIKTATMQQLLTGKKRLPGFKGDWNMKKLGDCLSYEQPSKYIVRSTEYLKNGIIAVLTANKSFILGYTSEDFGIFNNTPVIIFDDFTTDSKFVDFPFKVKSSALKILKLKNNNEANIRYLFEIMKIINFNISDHKRYWISEYQKIELPMPNFKEQLAIASVLTDMGSEIQFLEQRLEKIKALKFGMMQELLTGRTRLLKSEELKKIVV